MRTSTTAERMMIARPEQSRAGRGRLLAVSVVAATALIAAGCGDDSSENGAGTGDGSDQPTILATTGIWSDVVSNIACDGLAEVQALIPVGGDPHAYEPSLQDRARMERADLVVANGLALEEGLEDTLEAVADSGTPVFEFAEAVEAIPFTFEVGHGDEDDHGDDDHGHDDHADDDHADDDHGDEDADDDHGDEDADDDHADDHGDDDHADDDHGDEDADDDHGDEDADDDHADDHGDDDHADDDHGDDDHSDEDAEEDGHGHDHSGGDPHVWFDPLRVINALSTLADVLKSDVGLDADAVDACLVDYDAELEAMHAEMEELVSQIPPEHRKLITNHDAYAYFADRYGFEVVGTVIPSAGTMAQASPAQLEELAQTIEHEEVRAIFAETQHSSEDAKALADRVGTIEIVTLHTGSLGAPGSGADTYIGFMRTNVGLIVEALS